MRTSNLLSDYFSPLIARCWRDAQYMIRFVDDESKAKRGGLGMDISHWPRVNVAQRPMQQNGFDCGRFCAP